MLSRHVPESVFIPRRRAQEPQLRGIKSCPSSSEEEFLSHLLEVYLWDLVGTFFTSKNTKALLCLEGGESWRHTSPLSRVLAESHGLLSNTLLW